MNNIKKILILSLACLCTINLQGAADFFLSQPSADQFDFPISENEAQILLNAQKLLAKIAYNLKHLNGYECEYLIIQWEKIKPKLEDQLTILNSPENRKNARTYRWISTNKHHHADLNEYIDEVEKILQSADPKASTTPIEFQTEFWF